MARSIACPIREACCHAKLRANAHCGQPKRSAIRFAHSPEALKKFLLVFKRKNFNAGIDVMGALRGAGASPNGTMKKLQFLLCIKATYKEFTFSEQLLYSFAHAYGCGDPDPVEGGKMHVAWKDFCEDIEAQDPKEISREDLAYIDHACRAGSFVLG